MKKNRSRFPKQLKIFLITLTIVLVVGIFLMLGHKGAMRQGTDMPGSAPTEAAQGVPEVITGVAESETPTAPEVTQAAVELVPAADTIADTAESVSEDIAEPTEAVKQEIAGAVALGSGISEEKIYTVDTAEEGKITFAFAGDILFDPGYAIYSKSQI